MYCNLFDILCGGRYNRNKWSPAYVSYSPNILEDCSRHVPINLLSWSASSFVQEEIENNMADIETIIVNKSLKYFRAILIEN